MRTITGTPSLARQPVNPPTSTVSIPSLQYQNLPDLPNELVREDHIEAHVISSVLQFMIVRPYQVHAGRHGVKTIYDDNAKGCGWHTKGSATTVTSFDASTVVTKNQYICRSVFVVDCKGLDHQRREQFNSSQDGCVQENTSTATLVRRLHYKDYAKKGIATTIQTIGLELNQSSNYNSQRKENDQPTFKGQLAPLHDKRLVFIFDECHHLHFGENIEDICEFVPKDIEMRSKREA